MGPMTSRLPLRIVTLVGVVALGAIAIANSIADALSPGPLRYSDLLTPLPTARIQAACRSSAISFGRSDLLVDCAVARSTEALNTLGSTRVELNREAQTNVIQALLMAPHESKLWLALALLQARLNQPNGESLKMSYLTGPNTVELVRPRLASAVSGDALANSDLKELAAGDIRLILLRRPDLKGTLIDAYRQASSSGKAFIEDRTSLFEPEFLASLKNAK
jgi:hypothetical protein